MYSIFMLRLLFLTFALFITKAITSQKTCVFLGFFCFVISGIYIPSKCIMYILLFLCFLFIEKENYHHALLLSFFKISIYYETSLCVKHFASMGWRIS